MPWKIGLIPVVVGVLKRDNKLLVAERPAGKPYSGYWEFPGGKVEPGETSEQAIHRELHEELGIEVLSAEFCFEHEHAYPDKTVHLHIWLISSFSGEPHSRENQQLRWVTLAEMLELRLLEGNWPILDKIRALLA
jgi:8-oxo-dGTP diphosphatase